MVRYFKDDRKRTSRGLQVYLILIGAAQRRETLAYQQLAKMLGYKGAGVLAQTLGLIMRWCKRNDLPALTCIVIGKKRGSPGTGLTTIKRDKFAAEQQRVFNFDWYSIFPPSPEELSLR